MKKIICILTILYCFSIVVFGQKRNEWGSVPGGYFFPPYFQHKSNLPGTSNPPTIAIVADSIGSSTIPTGMYEIDSAGQHPFAPGSGGGGGGMVIGNSVSGSTPGSILYADGSSNLAQSNANLYWDYTNFGLGINNNGPVSDAEIYHNASGNKLAGLILSRNAADNGNSYLDFVDNRGTRGSPASPSASDSAGTIRWRKWNGSVQQTIAQVRAQVTGTPSTTNLPGEIDISTNTVATPSLLTRAASFDNTQTLNSLHLVVGSASPSVDANAVFSLAEILGTEPNLGYAGGLMLNDNSGVSANNGLDITFGVETGVNVWTGGSRIKGYKVNGTATDYSAGMQFFSRTNGSPQAEVFRINEQQHMLVGMTSDSTAGVLQVNGASWFSDSVDLKNVRTGTTSDSVAVLHQLSPGKFVLHRVAQSSIGGGGGVTTVGTFSGSSQTNGASIATNTITFGPADATNPGMIKPSGAQTLGATLTMPAPKLTGLASAGTSDSVLMWNPSTNQVEYKTGTFNLFAANGLTAAGGDSLYLGGSLNQNTTINLGTNTLNLTGSGGGIINFFASLDYNYTATGDANYTITDGAPVYLLFSSITANRTITLPSAGTNGRTIIFYNGNTGSFNWSFSSSVSYPDGGTLTTLAKNTWYTIYAQAGTWYVMATYSRSQPLSYMHTIFTPTTGGTVNLVNGQYNIINPAGSLATLTVNLPSSPANNDVVFIKYTQSVTTVTYGNGTVVDGITTPSVGGLVVLTYDSSTTSWY